MNIFARTTLFFVVALFLGVIMTPNEATAEGPSLTMCVQNLTDRGYVGPGGKPLTTWDVSTYVSMGESGAVIKCQLGHKDPPESDNDGNGNIGETSSDPDPSPDPDPDPSPDPDPDPSPDPDPGPPGDEN